MRNKTSFAGAPKVHRSRSMFDLSNQVSASFQHGRLYPLGTPIEVLPGDTITLDMASLIRMNTPVNAFMGNIYCDIYAFFVPNRLVWNHWKQFMGEPESEAWTETTEYTIPTGVFGVSNPANYAKTIGAYYGLPRVNGIRVNELPLRGYALIHNNYFRDQNYQNNILVTLGDASNTGITYGSALARVNKLHDLFTSVLPQAQRTPDGQSVSLPLGSFADVVVTNNVATSTSTAQTVNVSNASAGAISPVRLKSGSVYDSALKADLRTATAATINDLRNAFSLQRYYEALARSGVRYQEILRGIFGVDPGDARAQIPEYLGGKRFPIQVNQVVNTAGSDITGDQTFNQKAMLGSTGAISKTFDSSSIFSKSFTEHGYIHILICFRKWNMYATGLAKTWMKKDKFDFYLPQFAHIGEVAINPKEVHCSNASDNENVFGYQEAWYDYRSRKNETLGFMNPSSPSYLKTMTLAAQYTDGEFVASGDWMYEDEQPINNVLAYYTDFHYLADFQLNIKAARILPMFSVPGLLDHD